MDGIYLESPDDLIEENFEEAFSSMATINCDQLDDFSDVSKYGIVQVAGDMFAQKVIIIYACRLPSNKTFNHDAFLRLECQLQSLYSTIMSNRIVQTECFKIFNQFMFYTKSKNLCNDNVNILY